MLPVLTASQMADLDKYTIERLGLDGKLLMSSAAREVLRVMRTVYPHVQKPVILAGTGNNGGDGVALAYYAQQDGLTPTLILCHPEITDPPRLSMDSTYFYRIAEQAYVPVKFMNNPVSLPEVMSTEGCDFVVDALFGTGLDRVLGDFYLKLVNRINMTSNPILAVDCPSGLNCTTGEVMGGAVEADLTVTMGYPKRGFFHPGAGRYLGDLHIAPLGFASLTEAAITPAAFSWPDAFWSALAGGRRADTHKGHYGRLLVVSGHKMYPGAPRLVAQAAVRTGSGLTRLVVPEPVYDSACSDPALMVDGHPADEHGGFAAVPSDRLLAHMNWADAMVIGPGLGDGEEQQQLVKALLGHRALPTVVDADALRALPVDSERGRWPLVLTPHVGELARLCGVIPDLAWERWFELARDVSREHEAFVLAKSNQCMVATPEGGLLFPAAGSPALATGGTGDVLAGIVGALLARLHAGERNPAERLAHTPADLRMLIAEIVTTAVNIHSVASDFVEAELGEESLSPLDLIEAIPAALSSMAEVAAME